MNDESQQAMEREAAAFDRRMSTRLAHGHEPDLRCMRPCDWFYNNPWRHPYLANMIFGRYLRFAVEHARPGRLLDIGSGPGHMSLELARNGFHVTGIDVSHASVALARDVAGRNPFREGFGSLAYHVADIAVWQPDEPFDTVTFFGVLHHVLDVSGILARVQRLLKPGGRVIVVEPARDSVSLGDGAVVALIRQLLSAHGGWFEELEPVTAVDAFGGAAAVCAEELRAGRGAGEAVQSPHDNSSHAGDIVAELRRRFREECCVPAFAFMPRVCGGVRGPDDEAVRRLVDLLAAFDAYALEIGLMRPNETMWAGTRR